MVELWISLDFIRFPNYEVSSLGRVRNVITGYILKGYKSNGYSRILLRDINGIAKQKFIHVLVASAFLGVHEDMTVDHIYHDKDDNTVWNLRWATKRGQSLNRTKYTCKGRPIIQLDLQGNFIRKWDKMKDASEALGILAGCITAACKGKQHTAGGYKWKYYIEIIENEEWKVLQLDNFQPIYVSSMGRICSIHGRILNGYPSNGYLVVAILNLVTNKYVLHTIHRLVAATFLGINNEMQVNHIYGNTFDNRIAHLEYVTPQQNTIHAIQTGLTTFDGPNRYRRAIGQFDDTENLIHVYESMKEASESAGISTAGLWRSCHNSNWKESGYFWRYLDVQI